MAAKLQQSDKFPSLQLKFLDGRTTTLPDDASTRYTVLLFYRGTWCPYYMRHLASYQAKKAELEALGATIVVASVESLEQTKQGAEKNGLTLDMAYGVTKEASERFGAWWSDDRGGYIQPAEFILGRGGVVLGSMYASGPVGRRAAEEVIQQISTRERRRIEQEQTASAASVR